MTQVKATVDTGIETFRDALSLIYPKETPSTSKLLMKAASIQSITDAFPIRISVGQCLQTSK